MSPPEGVTGPRISLSVLQEAAATRPVRAARRVRLLSRDILMISWRGSEVGFEAEREDVRAQRVESAVEGQRLGGGHGARPLVDAAAGTAREDVRVGAVHRDRAERVAEA